MKKLTQLLFALLIALAGCEKDDDDNGDDDKTTDDKTTLTLDIDNLTELPSDEQYEGWIIVDGSPVSTGTFTVDASGNLSETEFEVDDEQLSSATDFVLSIEPKPDSDPAPSQIKILGGPFVGQNAAISVAHSAALGTDFSTASGKYILATPTTTDTTDENSGIWFLDVSGLDPVAGLNLPDLPSGWVYEGWVVMEGTPVTTGIFTTTTTADSSAPYSGTDASGPGAPGEDFIQNAPSGLTFPTDISGNVAVISVEPYPDNSPKPFLIKPLKGTIPTDAEDHVTYQMDNNVSGLPNGTVSR